MALPAEDIVAIEQLVARYNHAVDSGDAATYAATFTPDGRFEFAGQRYQGTAELEQFVHGLRLRTPRHVTSNVLVAGEGDHATLKAYIQMFMHDGDPPTQVVAASGIYTDELVRVGGEWRFEHRLFTLD